MKLGFRNLEKVSHGILFKKVNNMNDMRFISMYAKLFSAVCTQGAKKKSVVQLSGTSRFSFQVSNFSLSLT